MLYKACRRFNVFCVVSMCLILSTESMAQIDSAKWEIELGAVISSEENLPFYLHSNVGGIYDYDFNGAYLRGNFSDQFLKKEKSYFEYGLEAYLLNQSPIFQIQEAYLEYNRGPLTFVGGLQGPWRTEMDMISTGEFGISNNARPFPKVGVYMYDYWRLPVLNELLAIKGSFFHGWLEKDRYIERPWVHGKTLYIKIGREKLSFTGGLNHYAQWAGTFVPLDDDLPDDWAAFWDVFIGNGQEDVSGGEGNGLGNHLGYWEFILKVKVGSADVELFNQSSFEDGRSSQFWSFENEIDRLWGVKIDLKEDVFLGIQKISLNYTSTSRQGGPGLPDETPKGVNNYGYGFGGRDDNYNNWLYRNGWTYKDRVIGSPLFIDRSLGEFYFDDFRDYGVSIINNRIQSLNLGLAGRIKSVDFKFATTLTKNFGTYAGLYEGRFKWEGIQTDPNFEYIFKTPLHQTYFMLELKNRPFKRNQNIAAMLKIGFDTGEITNNFGMQLGFSYSGFMSQSKRKN